MTEKLTGICPCGFSFITPHGEDDAVSVMQHHVELVHKKEYPNGQTKADALEHIKKA